MEADWVAERSMLRRLITLHPNWTNAQVASCLQHSESWVKKWRKRFRQTAPDDHQVLLGHSRARHTPPPSTSPEVVQRILDLRDNPPENLQREPGPKALLYYLPRHAEGLPEAGTPASLDQNDLENPEEQRSHPGGSSSQAQALGTA